MVGRSIDRRRRKLVPLHSGDGFRFPFSSLKCQGHAWLSFMRLYVWKAVQPAKANCAFEGIFGARPTVLSILSRYLDVSPSVLERRSLRLNRTRGERALDLHFTFSPPPEAAGQRTDAVGSLLPLCHSRAVSSTRVLCE